MRTSWVTSSDLRQSDECAQVDEAWQTPTEQPPPPPVDPICCFGGPHPRYEPLILDLNGDGIHTTSVDEWPVAFDLTGDGIADITAWTSPTTEEGILYYDHNHNGVIDGGAELFGDATVMPGGLRARHGFEALAAYDQRENGGDEDGVISPADRVWGKLRLWVDRDQNGAVSPDENYSLGAMHVIELGLAYLTMTAAEQYGEDASGNWHLMKGSFVQRIAGTGGNTTVTRAMHDVFFRVRVGAIMTSDDH